MVTDDCKVHFLKSAEVVSSLTYTNQRCFEFTSWEYEYIDYEYTDYESTSTSLSSTSTLLSSKNTVFHEYKRNCKSCI